MDGCEHPTGGIAKQQRIKPALDGGLAAPRRTFPQGLLQLRERTDAANQRLDCDEADQTDVCQAEPNVAHPWDAESATD